MGRIDQRSQLGRLQPRQHPLEELFLQAPDPRLAQRHRQRPALAHGRVHPLQAAQVVGQRPVHQHRRLALGLQAVEHAQRTRRVARQHRLAEAEDVVARDIEHRRLDLLARQHRGRAARIGRRVQQRQLGDLLMGRQQIALDPVGEEGQRLLAGLAVLDAQAVLRQALRDPDRQRAALDRIDPHRQPGAVERAEPGAAELGAVQARQQHQRDVVVADLLDIALQRLGAVLARLAGGNADLDQPALGEQAQRAGIAQQAGPVEMTAGDGMHRALAAAGRTRGGAHRVGRLLRQQRLVAMNDIERAQALGQGGGELVGADLHGGASVASKC